MQQLEMDQRIIGARPEPVMENEQRPWGRWTVLSEGRGFKVKLLEISPGQRLSLQYHEYRSENWVVISGTARVVVDDETIDLESMQTMVVPVRTVHRIENPFDTPVFIVEVQQGIRLDEDDIVRLEDDYNRQDSKRRQTL